MAVAHRHKSRLSRALGLELATCTLRNSLVHSHS
jgi:hypothetical protein